MVNIINKSGKLIHSSDEYKRFLKGSGRSLKDILRSPIKNKIKHYEKGCYDYYVSESKKLLLDFYNKVRFLNQIDSSYTEQQRIIINNIMDKYCYKDGFCSQNLYTYKDANIFINELKKELKTSLQILTTNNKSNQR